MGRFVNKKDVSLFLIPVIIISFNLNTFAEVKSINWDVINLNTSVNAFKGEIDLSKVNVKES